MELTKELIRKQADALMNAIADSAQDVGFEAGFVMLGRSKEPVDGQDSAHSAVWAKVGTSMVEAEANAVSEMLNWMINRYPTATIVRFAEALVTGAQLRDVRATPKSPGGQPPATCHGNRFAKIRTCEEEPASLRPAAFQQVVEATNRVMDQHPEIEGAANLREGAQAFRASHPVCVNGLTGDRRCLACREADEILAGTQSWISHIELLDACKRRHVEV